MWLFLINIIQLMPFWLASKVLAFLSSSHHLNVLGDGFYNLVVDSPERCACLRRQHPIWDENERIVSWL